MSITFKQGQTRKFTAHICVTPLTCDHCGEMITHEYFNEHRLHAFYSRILCKSCAFAESIVNQPMPGDCNFCDATGGYHDPDCPKMRP